MFGDLFVDRIAESVGPPSGSQDVVELPLSFNPLEFQMVYEEMDEPSAVGIRDTSRFPDFMEKTGACTEM